MHVSRKLFRVTCVAGHHQWVNESGQEEHNHISHLTTFVTIVLERGSVSTKLYVVKYPGTYVVNTWPWPSFLRPIVLATRAYHDQPSSALVCYATRA